MSQWEFPIAKIVEVLITDPEEKALHSAGSEDGVRWAETF
jgi:hypothetical protein